MSELFWADALLYCHLLYVLCVAVPAPLIVLGKIRTWRWTRNLWLRSIHLGMIGVVALLALLDIPCPLTIWEIRLRIRADRIGYDGIPREWAAQLLYYDADPWVFTALYVAFAGLVLALWRWAPPTFRSHADE